MVTNLFVPDRKIVVPKPPSYLKLDMAFAIGEGAKLMDKSRYRSHGTISGADWADGAHGRCLDFVAATPSYVEIPAAYTQLDFTSEDFSIIIRLNADSIANTPYIYCRSAFNEDGYMIYADPTGLVRLLTHQSGANQLSTTAIGAIVAGTNQTLGVSRDGASAIIYINGLANISVVGVHQNPTTCDRSAMIGVYDNKVNSPFDGKIEFLRIFGGIALTAKEHLAWHNALA